LTLIFHNAGHGADLNNATPADRKAMLLRIRIRLTDTIPVTVENTPVAVEIDGTPTVEIDHVPLSVQIER
jgi:hypothetical protein